MKHINRLPGYFLVAVLLLFGIRDASGQTNYGFEWIRSYQPYFKLTIPTSGLYRIDSAYLVANGIDVSKFKLPKIQLFRNGKELPVYCKDAGDGYLNSADYIEFYGYPNDGTLDTEMYRTAAEQPHTFRSQFSDTAIYFLTILPDTSAILPLRFTDFSDADFGSYTPETGLIRKETVAQMEEYYYGTFLPSDQKYYLSEYGDAEGMIGNLTGQGQSRSITIQTPGAAASTSFVEIKVIGASDFALADPNSPNHHLRVYVSSPALAQTLLIDTLFKGYGERLFYRNIPASAMSSDLTFRFEVVNDIGVSSDFIGTSYINLKYTRTGVWTGAFESIYLNNPIAAARTFIQYTQFSGSSPVLYDLKQNIRTTGNLVSGTFKALLPFSQGSRQLIFSDETLVLKPASVKEVAMKPLDPLAGYQFLIVSSPYFGDAAEQYRAYRAEKWNTLLVYTEDICNYYMYGYIHPLAIRRMCKHLYEKQNSPPQYLLLLGRGYQNNLLRLNPDNHGLNHVPALGVPSSDNMFTCDFGSVGAAPAIATGRVPAASREELLNYLDKVKFYETNPDSIQYWRKHFLHLSGGSYSSQQDQFRNQLAYLAGSVKLAPKGAHVSAYYKSSTAPSESKLQETLIGHLNNGVGMMTFYGHGSLTVLDMDFGGIADLHETDKYTFYYFNGCNIGNANDIDPLGTGLVYGKDYICAKNKGAIGWLAHTNLTMVSQLESQMDHFYRNFKNLYGIPVGLQIKEALEESSQGNEPYARSHALQLLLQGDPGIVLYSPSLPDYKVSNSDLFIYPDNANIQNDSLAVGIIISNLAKAVDNDTIEISLTRTLPDNSIKGFSPVKTTGTFDKDTIFIWVTGLKNTDIGINHFDVTINGTRKASELDYSNNSASINYYIPGSGVRLLLPFEYSIQNMDSVELVVQNNNLLAKSTEYLIELDTSLTFSAASPFYKTSGPINADNLCKWKVKISSQDSTVYFWRAKLNIPESEGGIWTTGNFTYIKNAPEGWHQQSYFQIANPTATRFIEFNPDLRKVEFSNNELALGITNRRWDHRNMGVVIPYLLNAQVGNCISQGTVVLVFEPFQVDFPYELPGYPFNCSYVQANKFDQSVRYYPFNTNTKAGEQDLKRLIDSVPQGYYVAMFSRYQSGIPQWDSVTKTLFHSIGSVLPVQIKSNNTAWGVIGRKGDMPGMAVEDSVINNELEGLTNLPPSATDPQDTRKMEIVRNIQLKWYEGDFVSAPVGPALGYHKLTLSMDPDDANPPGRWWYDVIGVKNSGEDTLLFSNLTDLNYNLSAVSARAIPFLKIKIHFVDSSKRTPTPIHFWQVAYDPATDVTVSLKSDYNFSKDVLDAGDSLRFTIPFENVGNRLFDSNWVKINIENENREVIYNASLRTPPILAGGRYLLKLAVPTFTYQGNYTLKVTFNPDRDEWEASYNNNFFSRGFLVKKDVVNPLLDVTFDGYRIMNNDYVSPNPVITVSSTDKNAFLIQRDTSTFSLQIRNPEDFDYTTVWLNDPRVTFIPADSNSNMAKLLFKPQNLKDGTYSLKAQARDVSGNKAGQQSFEVDFKVLNKSTITHFYPYPNPFTTSMRFVFTLTGSKVPDQLLVRILTINGKVVREIRKEEFGSIRIGQNISEFAWDGTDQFGDKLANGVYLYQVYTRIEGNTIDNKATNAKDESSYFVNGTGKIFLMR